MSETPDRNEGKALGKGKPEHQTTKPNPVAGVQAQAHQAASEQTIAHQALEILPEWIFELVVNPINKKYPKGAEIDGQVYSGEAIARMIPDLEAFLREVDLQCEAGVSMDFLEINASGELVMKDNCKEAYALEENACQARIRQTRIVYLNEAGAIATMTGEDVFTILEKDSEGRPVKIEKSEAALKINPESILMVRGLPKLDHNEHGYVGEYAKMNQGQLDVKNITFVDDCKGDPNSAVSAFWYEKHAKLQWNRRRPSDRNLFLGSRGVLRVKLKV